MSTPANRIILEYADVAGAFLRAQNWLQLTGFPLSFAAAVQAATNANLAFVTYGQPIVGTTTPSGSMYQSVQDILLVTMQTTSGSYVQMAIPAPLGSMFLSGGTVIDPTNTFWMNLLASIKLNVTDSAGNAATTLVSAVKSSRRSDQYNG